MATPAAPSVGLGEFLVVFSSEKDRQLSHLVYYEKPKIVKAINEAFLKHSIHGVKLTQLDVACQGEKMILTVPDVPGFHQEMKALLTTYFRERVSRDFKIVKASTSDLGYWHQGGGIVYDDLLPNPMTPQAAAHIQSEAIRRGEDITHGSFASRAMQAAANNVALGVTPSLHPIQQQQQGSAQTGSGQGGSQNQAGQNQQQQQQGQQRQGQQQGQGQHQNQPGQGQQKGQCAQAGLGGMSQQGQSQQGQNFQGGNRRNQTGFWHQQGGIAYRDMLPNPMTPHAAELIRSQSAHCGEETGPGSFAARALEAAAHNVQLGIVAAAQTGPQQGTYWDIQNGIVYDDMLPAPMTPEAAAHIMSETARRGEDTSHGSFAVRAHAAAVHNIKSGIVPLHAAGVIPGDNQNAGGLWRYGASWDCGPSGMMYRDMLPNPMTPEAAAHIQSECTRRGEDIGPDSFAARAQSAAAQNVLMGIVKPLNHGSGAATGGQQTGGNQGSQQTGQKRKGRKGGGM